MDNLLDLFIEVFDVQLAEAPPATFQMLWRFWLNIWDMIKLIAQIILSTMTIPIVEWEITFVELIFGGGLIILILLGVIKFIIDVVI